MKIDTVKRLLRKSKLILHEGGLSLLLKRLPTSLMRVLVSKTSYLIYENDLDSARFSCKVNNLTLKVVTCQEELDQLSDEGFNLSQYKTYSDGSEIWARCYYAFVDKEFAYRRAMLAGRNGVSAHLCPSSMDDGHTVFWGNTFTVPEYRRQGIHIFATCEAYKELKANGMSRFISIIDKSNTRQVKFHDKIGSHLLGKGYKLRLLNRFTFWRANYFAKPK